MNKRVFSFTLSFTVLSVAVMAVNCGCLLAEMVTNSQVSEHHEMEHCNKSSNEGAEGAKECCSGCKVEFASFDAKNINFLTTRIHEFHSVSFHKIEFLSPKRTLHTQSPDRKLLATDRGVSIPTFNQPIFLVLRSLLI